MKRDMELVRKILLHIEEFDDVAERPIPADDIQNIAYHLSLLVDAGFITGVRVDENHLTGEFIWFQMPVPRLTWTGHEFLDAAKSDTVWNEAKRRVGGGIGTVSFSVLTQLLMQIAKQHLGLP